MGRIGTGLKSVSTAVLALCLTACASESGTAKSTTPASAGVSGESEAVNIPTPEDFTTVGKPTKTIQTPNGPAQIYDPTRDVEIMQLFMKWYEEDRYAIVDYSEHLGRSKEWEVFLRAEALQALDLKRAGCEAVIQSNDRLESYNQVEKGGLKPRTKLLYFTKDCGDQHSFGADDLTACEASNKSIIPKSIARRQAFKSRMAGEQTLEAPMEFPASEVGVTISYLQKRRGNFNIIDNGVKNEIIGESSGKSYLSQLSDVFSQKCEKWRGMKPHEQISYMTKEGFSVFLLDFYPGDPLAPPEFQTPEYRDFITSNREEIP